MYKNEKSFEVRSHEARRVLEKYPDRVPMVVERAEKSTMPEIDKRKFLTPRDFTVGQWLSILRRRISLKSSEGLFVLVNEIIPTTSSLVGDIYDKYKCDDGLLYWTYCEMSTFGSDYGENESSLL